MNTEIEKKWFIYVDDHHEGPFSLEEVYLKHKNKAVTSETYFWKEGMADWLMLSQIDDLLQELKKKKSADDLLAGKDDTFHKVQDSTQILTVDIDVNMAAQPKSTQTTQTVATHSFENESLAPQQQKKTKTLGALKWIAVFFSTFIILLMASIATLALISRQGSESLYSSLRPTFISMTSKIPLTAKWIKLIPNLPDLTNEDRNELEQALTKKPQEETTLTFALSKQDANRPFFYVASNLPLGTKFDILLVGNGETLLNRLQYTTQTSVTLNSNFSKSEVVLGDGGQPIPKGEYNIYITESPDQDPSVAPLLEQLPPLKLSAQVPTAPHPAKFAVTKTLFLGGEKDQTYQTRLKAFHDKVKETSAKELTELKQYTDMLDQQMAGSVSEFKKILLTKKITPQQRLSWHKKTEQWKGILSQMDQTLQTWSDETLKNDFFYGKIYGYIKITFQSIKSLLEIEDSYVNKPSNKTTFEIQHNKALSEASDALDLLKAKLGMAMQAPKTASGLPTREGL